MSRTEVRIAGFGGQGVVLAGVILGRAAALHDGKYACQTQSYGAEARGGAARSEIVIADTENEILDPLVETPDVFVAMSQEAYDRYVIGVKESAIVVVDLDLVKPHEPSNNGVFAYPATYYASQNMQPIVANMIMLGAMNSHAKLVSPEALQNAVKGSVPPKTVEINLKALEVGYTMTQERE